MNALQQSFAGISGDMLTSFLKVAELASVSTASKELGIAKSQVSKRVAQLESLVQATLFSRSTRRLELTPAGEAYIEHARRALAELAAGEERVRALRSELSGKIRVTAPVSWGQRVLSKHLPPFLRSHPSIEVELVLADTMMDLISKKIDIALRWSPKAVQAMSSVPVARITWSMVASPQYLSLNGMPEHPRDLARHSCLCYWRESADDAWTFIKAANIAKPDEESATVQTNGRLHVDNAEVVSDACAAGLGIALLPDYLCAQRLADGELVKVLPDWEPQTKFGCVVSALMAPERMGIPRNRTLLEFLKKSLAS